MKVVFAQGNPGPNYADTRHNAGMIVLESFAKLRGIQFQPKSKFHADIAEFSHAGEKILLVKPTTFYNETGQSMRQLVDFYKLDPSQDVVVIHDDLALPFGTIRTRVRGSDAGNNGIKSLNAHIGEQYARIRIGIFNDLRERMDDADFVLAKFSQEERRQLDALSDTAIEIIESFIAGAFVITSHAK